MKTLQAPSLPDDLIVEILSWLPVKSLLQFRCVCKLWKSVISDPYFVKLYLHRSGRTRKDNLLLNALTKYVCRFVACSVSSLVENPSYTIDEDASCYLLNGEGFYFTNYQFLGSCNGLFCFLKYFIIDTFDLEYRFYLCNPATKLLTSKKLASLSLCERDHYHRFAFGYDNLSDTYKVLAFSEEAEEVKICSLGDNNCWRNVPSFPVVPFFSLHFQKRSDGVYFNGTLNWLAFRNIKLDHYKWDDTITVAQLVIVSFDLGMHTYTQLLLPPLDEAPHDEPLIGVLMDYLCFFHDCTGTHFVVWQMKEFGVEKSWTQFMKVSYQNLRIDPLGPVPLLPLCMSENGDVLMMAIAGKFQAILYHRRDNRVEQTKFGLCWDYTMDYVESLVSPYCN